MRKSGSATRTFLPDTNVFVAALKSPRKESKTLQLIIALIENESIELIGDEFLVEEMARYAEELTSETASWILAALLEKMEFIDVDGNFVKICKAYIKTPDLADIVHAAACLKTGAVLVTNDRHFDRIRDEGIIEVWSVSEAIEEIL
jgi:predicted nucleic acid-binding protein